MWKRITKLRQKKFRWGSKGYLKINFTAEIIFSVLNKAKKKKKNMSNNKEGAEWYMV